MQSATPRMMSANPMRPVKEVEPTQRPQDSGQKAFSNPIIVQTVLRCLSDFHHLLTSCRLVCKLWEEEATRELLSSRHETNQTVHFKWDKESQNFCGSTRRSLGGLTEFYENVWKHSRRFPVSQFAFEIGDLGSPDASLFLSNVGKHIKCLTIKLEDSQCPTAISTFRHLFFEWLPNLKNLTIAEPGSATTTRLERSDEQVGSLLCPKRDHHQSFPQLETLKIFELPENKRRSRGEYTLKISTSPMIRDMYMNAPNLKLVPSMYMSYPEEMMAIVPFQQVDSIRWKITMKNYRTFDHITKAGQKLKNLCLNLPEHLQLRPEIWILTQQAFNRLFTTSSATLKNLKLDEGIQFLPMIELPIFKKVLFLHMTFSSCFRTLGKKTGHILPAGYHVAQVFPNLTSLAILGDKRNCHSFWSPSDYPHVLSRSENSSPTVTLLFLRPMFSLITEEIVTSAKCTYPMLNQLALDIKDITFLLPLLPAIWRHLTQLQDLAVHLDLGLFFTVYVNDEWISKVDSAITGIPIEQCRILLELQNVEVDPELYQTQPRETPSILNMTELKQLCIVDITLERNLIYSDVTRLYGIEPMKKRQKTKFFTEFYRPISTGSFCLFENCPICRTCVYDE